MTLRKLQERAIRHRSVQINLGALWLQDTLSAIKMWHIWPVEMQLPITYPCEDWCDFTLVKDVFIFLQFLQVYIFTSSSVSML